MLPTLMAARAKERRIRMWCAAAATGQEPYSLAMELAERDSRLVGWTVEIVATDFVEDALNKARKGLYSQFEVQRGLPVSLLVKYFTKVGNAWEISPDIRRRVSFRTHNLLDGCQEPRHLRRHLLPKRPDLCRRHDQARHPGATRGAACSGRLSRAWRGGDHYGLER